MFRLAQVEKRFGGVAALSVDLEIPRGRTTVLLGPSGCGKSTLLRLLVGLLRADAGTVFFDGRPLLDGHSGLAEARRRIGYVIQEGGLFPHLTARDNVLLPARTRPPAERPAIEARLDGLAAMVQLAPDIMDRYPLELSGGQRQRLGILRALLLDPEALLLDEPLSALDPLVRADLRADLGRIVRTLGKTVVLVTHDLADAVALGDEIVLLRAGRIVQRGPLGELVERPADPFVTRFIESQRVALGSPGRP